MELCLSVLHHPKLENRNIQHIAVVQGPLLAAVSNQHFVVITLKNVYFSFPEILFNLFPRMSAYSYLIRRTTPLIARQILTSGKRYSARRYSPKILLICWLIMTLPLIRPMIIFVSRINVETATIL